MNCQPLIHSSRPDIYGTNRGNPIHKNQCSSVQIFDFRDHGDASIAQLVKEFRKVMHSRYVGWWHTGVLVVHGWDWRLYWLHHCFWLPIKVNFVAVTGPGSMYVVKWRWWTREFWSCL